MSMNPSTAAIAAVRNAEGDPFHKAKAVAMVAVWSEYQLPRLLAGNAVLGVEQEFNFPLLNPETGGQSKSFLDAGKFDGLLRGDDGSLRVLEHKTSSLDIGDGAPYWDKLDMDVQVSKYLIALEASGEAPDAVLYDVLKKPGIRPKELVPDLDDDGIPIVIDSFGDRVEKKRVKKGESPWRTTADAKQGYSFQGHEETPAEFEARCLDILRAAPGDHFKMKEIHRLDSAMFDYMMDAHQVGKSILFRRQHDNWPRNPDACHAYNSQCEYFDLCCGRAQVDGIRYAQREQRHAELEMKEPSGMQFLTKSRMGCLAQCPRKHKLRYEDCIEAVFGDEREALLLGSLVHLGMEAALKAVMSQES